MLQVAGTCVWEALVHRSLWKELPPSANAAVRRAMQRLQETSVVARAPGVRRLEGSAYPRSYRLRVGRHRVCFIQLPDESTLVFTTAFLKRRAADYARAVVRHDERVRAFE